MYSFFPKFPSHPGCQITWSRLPCWNSHLLHSFSNNLFIEHLLSTQPSAKHWGGEECHANAVYHLAEQAVNQQSKAVCASVQFSSAAQSCPTLCYPMDCSTPGLPVHHQILMFTQTHVHWVSDTIQLSHPLSSSSPPSFNLSQHQGLLKGVSSLYQVAKVLELQIQHQSFQWIFRTDFL